jgi:hypothetical protein
MQLRVVPAKPGMIVHEPLNFNEMLMCCDSSMGLGAGGKMKQQIDKDRYGIDTWDLPRASEAFIHIVNSTQWTAITGEPLPSTPIDASTYTQFGLPWFDLYRDDTPAVTPSETLTNVKTVSQVDQKKRLPKQHGDDTIPIPSKQVKVVDEDKGWPKE